MIRLSLALICLAAPAFAQSNTFNLPQGCTAYLTVQMRSCTVSHHFTCEGDPTGYQQRVDLDERGLTYVGTIDAETQWISSFHPFTGHSEMLAPSPAKPASLSALLATNVNEYDFETNSAEIGTTRYVGTDRLTGKTVTIDGVTLDQTEYAIRALAPDGSELWRSSGNEFISREWRMFLSGTGTVVTPDDSFDTDDTPMEFINPGEPGFLSANPKFGCGAVLSSWEVE
jgi:hypothetical protein